MSCDQCTMDHNGNELNDLSFTFCVIHGTDYVTFCFLFYGHMFYMYVLNICAFYVCLMCYVIFIKINYYYYQFPRLDVADFSTL